MTTIIAPTPFVGQVVEDVRCEHDWSAALGVPAHITLLGPFLHPDDIGHGVVSRLARLIAAHEPPDVSLAEVALLNDAACLVPADPEPFRVMSRALHDAWPDVAPHRGVHHITIARAVDDATFTRVSARIAPDLPLVGAVTEVLLVERRGNDPVDTIAQFELAPVA